MVLNRVSGALQPGRITLLLGPPASGKSTLLKALTGALSGSGLKVNREHTLPVQICADLQSSALLKLRGRAGDRERQLQWQDP